MLAALRNVVRSFFFKIFLGLLVLSFAIWGVGDIFVGGSPNRVATVGELELTAMEVDDRFRRALQELQQRSPEPITRTDAIRLGFLEQTLQSLVAQGLIDAEARQLGLTTPDATVAAMIAEEPAFQQGGRFDRERFRAILRQNGLDETAFAEQLRAERTREALTGSIRPPTGLPESLKGPLAEHLGEARSGELLVVEAARFAELQPASDAELQRYLDENQARFEAPERRDVTAVLLEPDALIAEIVIDEGTLRERYTAEAEAYVTPERRRVRQLRGAEAGPLQEAYAALTAGDAVDDVAGRIDGVAVSDLGAVEQTALPANFAGPIFAAPVEGSITAPTESAFGWHVFVVDAIEPAGVVPFADVRDEIERALAAEQAVTQLPDLATALDDALGGGASLEAAATDLDLPLVTVDAIDRAGRTPDGAVFEPFAAWGTLVTEAFGATAGEVSLLEETADGRYFVFRLDAVDEPRPLALEEARDDVLAAWQGQQARERAREAVETAADAIAGGASVEEVVREHDMQRRTVGPITRTDSGIDASVQTALFDHPPGTEAATVIDVSDGAAILSIDSTTFTESEVAAATRSEVDAGFARDLLVQYELALRREHPVRVDRAALDRLFPVEMEP